MFGQWNRALFPRKLKLTVKDSSTSTMNRFSKTTKTMLDALMKILSMMKIIQIQLNYKPYTFLRWKTINGK